MNNVANMLGELVENIFIGFPIPEKFIKNGNDINYIYLTPQDINKGIIPSQLSKGVYEKDLRREELKGFNTRMHQVEYGDFLLFLQGDIPYLVAYANQLGSRVIVSDDILIMRSPNSYLKNFLQNKEGHEYVLDEIKREQVTEITKLYDFIKELYISEEYLSKKRKSEPLTKSIDLASIKILPRPTSLDNILKRLKNNEINIFTPFQRKASVWKDTKIKSRFIESILINLFPLPNFYFDATNDDEWLVIDGLQRLSVIREFYEGGMILENMEYLTELNGKSYETLERKHQRAFEEREVTMFIVYPGTPKEVKYSIFQRLNTSEPLNPQEIRYALNPGMPCEYVDKLSESKEFQELIGDKLDSKSRERRLDAEIVLHYLAFRLYREDKLVFHTDTSYFLDIAMIALYELSELNFETYKSSFNDSLRKMKAIFKNDFDKIFVYKNPVNNNIDFQVYLFQSWIICLSELPKQKRAKINPTKTKEMYDKRLQDSKSIANFLPRVMTSESGFQTKIDIIKEIIVYD